MNSLWKKVAMLMVTGLLIAGPLGRLPHAAADNSAISAAHTALGASEAAQAQAEKMYQQMMTHMDSMKKMPMSANEKAMMDQMTQMAGAMKALMDSNKQLMEAVKNLLKDREGGGGK